MTRGAGTTEGGCGRCASASIRIVDEGDRSRATRRNCGGWCRPGSLAFHQLIRVRCRVRCVQSDLGSLTCSSIIRYNSSSSKVVLVTKPKERTMAKMQDKRWQRLQTLATAFRETGDTQSVKLLYEEIHPYIWAAVRGSRYGVVDDASQDWCSQIRCDVFRLLKSPSWHPRRQPFATMLTRVTTNSLHTMWQRVRYSNERVNHEALSIDWMNELLGDAWEREVLEAVPHNSRYDQVTDRFVVHTLRRVSDRATRQTIDAVLRKETIADAAKYLQVTPTCVRRRLRQLGKDMACVEQILDPWPVVFQEAVLEGNVTLHCPSPPFYAAVPIQRQTSSQWGLSVGGQVRRGGTRTIHVNVLNA